MSGLLKIFKSYFLLSEWLGVNITQKSMKEIVEKEANGNNISYVISGSFYFVNRII